MPALAEVYTIEYLPNENCREGNRNNVRESDANAIIQQNVLNKTIQRSKFLIVSFYQLRELR